VHVVADIQRDIVIIDGVLHQPIPSGVAIAQIGAAHKLSVRHIDQAIGDRYADLHALHLVAPLVFVRPPDASAGLFARGVDPWMAGRIFTKRDGAESARLHGMARVVEVDGVDAAHLERPGEVHEDRSCIPLVLEPLRAEEDFVDMQRGVQVKLDAPTVLEHPEAHGVLALNEFFVRIDANVEVVKEQVVVGAIGTVRPAQNIAMCSSSRAKHGRSHEQHRYR
jgi:hypothetical protein